MIQKVKDIIETDLDDGIVQAYVDSAGVLVNQLPLADPVKSEVQKWLAAHFIAIRDKISVHEEAGTAEIQYSDVFGENLSSSHYGQTAMVMDTSGRLQSISQSKTIIKLIAL